MYSVYKLNKQGNINGKGKKMNESLLEEQSLRKEIKDTQKRLGHECKNLFREEEAVGKKSIQDYGVPENVVTVGGMCV